MYGYFTLGLQPRRPTQHTEHKPGRACVTLIERTCKPEARARRRNALLRGRALSQLHGRALSQLHGRALSRASADLPGRRVPARAAQRGRPKRAPAAKEVFIGRNLTET